MRAALARTRDSRRRSPSRTMPTWSPPESRAVTGSLINWCACGRSATASGSAAIRRPTGSGRAATWWCTLDPNERFCGCGGLGHLESIMGHRAMRLRFLDMEPEEVFAAAKSGEDPRCAEFAILWHRALAAATATSIHMSGPGKFYITGPNARFVNVAFSEPLRAGHGEDEPAARLRVRGRSEQRRNRRDRRGGECSPTGLTCYFSSGAASASARASSESRAT